MKNNEVNYKEGWCGKKSERKRDQQTQTLSTEAKSLSQFTSRQIYMVYHIR